MEEPSESALSLRTTHCRSPVRETFDSRTENGATSAVGDARQLPLALSYSEHTRQSHPPFKSVPTVARA